MTLPSEYGDFAGDRVLFQLRASGSGELTSGQFNIVHLDDTGVYAHLVGDVTCLAVTDGLAVATGIIRHAWLQDVPGSAVVGTAAAITVADGGENDVLGFDFEFFESTIAPCGEETPFIPVDRGNFTLLSS